MRHPQRRARLDGSWDVLDAIGAGSGGGGGGGGRVDCIGAVVAGRDSSVSPGCVADWPLLFY